MSGRDELIVKSLTCVAPVSALLGEGPLWDPRDNRLYWLDIKGEAILRYDPETGLSEKHSVSGMISALGLAASGGFICATRDGFAKLAFDGDAVLLSGVADPEADKPGNRFNDGKVDPAGGFWAGSMDDAENDVSGSWWRLNPDGEVMLVEDSYKVTNGPAFDSQRKRVYLTDSAAQRVYVAQSNGESMSKRQVFLQFHEDDGYPDGMEVDAEGCLWIAFWDGAAVRRFSPEGELLFEIEIPALRPTSVALIGDRMFVTSASIGLNEAQLRQYPKSGGLFQIVFSRQLASDNAIRYFDDAQVSAS